MRRSLPVWGFAAILLLALGGLLALGVLGAGLPAAPRAPSATAPRPTPAHYAGATDLDTASFALPAGSHRVDWTATDATGIGCVFFVTLNPDSPPGQTGPVVADKQIGPGIRGSGRTPLKNLPAGSYFLRVISHCAWTLTVDP